MEYTNRTHSEVSKLDYSGDICSKLKQRKILDAYVKMEHDKSKKIHKSQIFIKENIQGFLQLLKINTNRLIFIEQDTLVSNLTLFMQNVAFNQYSQFETIHLEENTVNILIEGELRQIKEIITRPSHNFLNVIISAGSQENIKGNNGAKKFKTINHHSHKARKSIRVSSKGLEQTRFEQLQADKDAKPKNLMTSTFLNHSQVIPKKTLCRKQNVPQKQIKITPDQAPYILDQSALSKDFKEIFDKQYIFQMRQQSMIATIEKSALNKLQTNLLQLEKEAIINFIGKYLGIDSTRLVAKIIPKITTKKFSNKEQNTIDHKKLFMLYKGQILLEDGFNFRLYMKQNTVLWPKKNQKYKFKFITQSYGIFIDDYFLRQQLQQHYPQILESIKLKINQIKELRQGFFENTLEQSQKIKKQESEIQEIFYTHNLPNKPLVTSEAIINNLRAKPLSSKTTAIKNMSKIHSQKDNNQNESQIKVISFDLSVINFGHDYTERRKNLMSNPKLKKKAKDKPSVIDCLSKQRFRVINSSHKNRTDFQSDQLFYEPEYKEFMSFYPFIKIIESEQKLEDKKKIYQKKTNKSNQFQPSRPRHVLKQSEIRQKKRIFYNQKVRKLKIRNIASKQIPNGHKKNFDADKAEKKIAQNSLISTIIQYPMEGTIKRNSTKIDLASFKKNGIKDQKDNGRKTEYNSSKIQDQFSNGLSVLSLKGQSKQIQGRLTSYESNFKRTTADPAQNSFYGILVDQTNNIKKISNEYKAKNLQKRPQTGGQNPKEKSNPDESHQNFFLKCERIKTEN